MTAQTANPDFHVVWHMCPTHIQISCTFKIVINLKDIILSEVTPSQKNSHVLTDKWILPQKLRLPKTQFAIKLMKLK